MDELIEECKKHLRDTKKYEHEYKKDIRKLITALERTLQQSEPLCDCKKHSIKTNYGFEVCTKCGNEFDD